GILSDETDRQVQGLWLFRNNGDGTFSQKTHEVGLTEVTAYGIGIAAADYDNDGDQDFYFTTLHKNMLFRNEGGAFKNVGEEAGVSGVSEWSSSGIFFDADRDGWLDLYVGNYAIWSPEQDKWCSMDGENKAYCPPEMYEGIPSRFYRNNRDGTFTDQTEEAGFLPAPGKSLGMAEFDFNDDKWPDLVVSNDGEGDLLYENNGDGTFTENGTVRGMAYSEHGEARAGMGIDVGVVDSSGHPSIFIGNFSNEMIGVYQYSDGGWFIDRAALSKIGLPSLNTLTFGLFLFDVEFDGDLDLFAANGHVYPSGVNMRSQNRNTISYRQSSQLFLNDGDGTFEEVGQKVGGVFRNLMVARGAAHGDYDRDGDPDILITENGGPAHLWRNDATRGNFLRVRLVGRKSNRDGIGSLVVAVAGNCVMTRRVRTGSSYLSQSETIVTFGLGEKSVVDSLRVQWPSGQVDNFVNIESNQEIGIEEGSGTFERQLLSDDRRRVAVAMGNVRMHSWIGAR
ncbi:MAG: CRTAC1 family protein, partial [Candidatus Neomarinimicrobiota bacterium]